MRTFLVDDSRLARAELRRLLNDHPTVDIVGEAGDPEEALALIERLQPELLFLDIQLPGMTGFQLLERLETTPHVVFTTAYGEYALRAFDFNALDYLVKPIEIPRLASALQKAGRMLPPITATNRPFFRETDRVFVKDGDRCWFVEVGEISLLEIVGSYTRLHFNGQNPLIPRTLNYLETRLDPTHFFRANRNQLINLRFVKRIEPWFNNGLVLTLHAGQAIQLSRRKAIRFRELMSF